MNVNITKGGGPFKVQSQVTITSGSIDVTRISESRFGLADSGGAVKSNCIDSQIVDGLLVLRY